MDVLSIFVRGSVMQANLLAMAKDGEEQQNYEGFHAPRVGADDPK